MFSDSWVRFGDVWDRYGRKDGQSERIEPSTKDQHGSHRQKMRTLGDTDRPSGKVASDDCSKGAVAHQIAH